MSLYELYIKGGFVMHFILCCSVFGFSIFLYKFFEFKEFFKIVSDKKFAFKYISGFVKNKNNEELEIFWSKKLNNLEKGISTINLLANVSTLFGLTGTVLGMIKTFMVISQHDFTTPKMLAGGIWEALLTTAFGLFVAIPLHISVHYLEKRFENLMFIFKERLMEYGNEIDNS
ncbi:MAG: MotA/TolQ/ExbB proton channel family protein [Endomicrobia bacterium]|nr:MotA/TolQ/ExbB proton channel family protein [Endomicrobiia bacterium]